MSTFDFPICIFALDTPQVYAVDANNLPTISTPYVTIPQGDGSFLMKPGKPIIQEEEIGTRAAARILGLSQRHMETILDMGVILKPGVDYRRNPCRPDSLRGGNYKILLASVLRLRKERAAP